MQEEKRDSDLVVRRWIRLQAGERGINASDLIEALADLPGLIDVGLKGDNRVISIHYDARELSYAAILDSLRQAGIPPAADWRAQIRGIWYAYLDANIRDNAKAPSRGRCNRPPK